MEDRDRIAQYPRFTQYHLRFLETFTDLPYAIILEMVRFLKIKNYKLQFLLPVCEIWNWESENNFFLILFTISFDSNSGSNSSKMCQRTGIAFLRNRNRATSKSFHLSVRSTEIKFRPFVPQVNRIVNHLALIYNSIDLW